VKIVPTENLKKLEVTVGATMAKKTTIGSDPGKEMLLRNTMDVLRAYMECSDAIQHGVLDMVAILENPEASEDEKAAAEDTLIESLYPQYVKDDLGIDSVGYEELQRKTEPDLEEELDNQEATFAKNLSAVMTKKGVTQSQLAEMVGIGQPAISMILARNCRPQRRTVEKIATALQMKPSDLWPGE
jgi:lambda repressor-like predicted transcriptional regulator